jgi:actin-like ATPase involved in cell morphogenesis
VAYRLAIDLGSANTVAVLRGSDGQLRPVLFDGSELLPSAVYADPGGTLIVGRDAERLARTDPGALEPNPKRRIDDGELLLGQRTVAVPDVLAAVLKRVVDQVGAQPAVLTCPSGWGEPRREILRTAAQHAGLGPVELVTEPIAAAAYYAATHDLRQKALCVIDVGAGTADVAVVAGNEIRAQAGIDIGGLDLDAALIEHLGDIEVEARDRVALWQEVRATKESLSRLSHAPVHVPGHDTDLHLTRDELNEVAAPLLTRIADLAADTVTESRLAPVAVLLVGGGSRIPLLATLLHTRLGIPPTVVERPETVVAEGALLAIHEPPPEPVNEPVKQSPPVKRNKRRRRWANPVTLGLALLCFLLPFATVSCGLSDGYGRAKPGGTTTYTGLDLALGGQPDVPTDQLRPADPAHPDRLPPQPLLLGTVLATAAALVLAIVLSAPGKGRRAVAILATVAALLLLAGQAVATETLTTRVQAQSTIPTGKTARDFVGTSFGFWFVLLLLLGILAGNLTAAWRGRRRRAPAPAVHPVTPTREGR